MNWILKQIFYLEFEDGTDAKLKVGMSCFIEPTSEGKAKIVKI
jgi:hypothetical protein